jgi:hypothetical protein
LVGLGVVVVLLLAPTTLARSTTSSDSDRAVAYNQAGTATFPTHQYGNTPVPQYINIVWASVQEIQGTFHFAVHVNATIPTRPYLGFGANHIGVTYGLLFNRSTAGAFPLVGHNQTLFANFLVGMIYTAKGDELHIGLGWRAFVTADGLNFTQVSGHLLGSTYLFQVSAAAIGNPRAMHWLAGAECDPVPNLQEGYYTTLVEDFAPNYGYAAWPAEP